MCSCNNFLQNFCKFFAYVLQFFWNFFASFLQNLSKLIWNSDMRQLFLLLMFFLEELQNETLVTSSSLLFLENLYKIVRRKSTKLPNDHSLSSAANCLYLVIALHSTCSDYLLRSTQSWLAAFIQMSRTIMSSINRIDNTATSLDKNIDCYNVQILVSSDVTGLTSGP